jgi:outer membrane protein
MGMKITFLRKSVLLGLLLAFSVAGFSQGERWTLNRCIAYARANNIKVKAASLSGESVGIDLKEARAQRLPSLQLASSQSLVNQKEPNQAGDYVGKAKYSGSYSLSSSMVLYNGGKLRTSIQQKEVNAKKAESDVLTAQNSIELAVTQSYLQVLYANESLKTSIKTLESSEATLKRATELLKAGSISSSDYAQLQSQQSSDRYQVTLGENDLAQAKLELKQLLELGVGESLELDFPEISDRDVMVPIPSIAQVYARAVETMPEMLSSRYAIDMAKLDAQKAYADRLPTVSLNASAGTGSYSNSGYTLYNQLNNGFNQSVGVTVGIPIFKNRSVRSNIERSNLQAKQAELSYTSTSKELQKTVETLYQNAVSGQSKYLAATDKLKSAKLSYELVQGQFNAGMKNTVELLTEKNSYRSAEDGLTQAKYQSVLSLKLLNFYQNQSITL